MEKLDMDDNNKIIKLIEGHNSRVSNWNLDKIGNMKILKNPQKTFDLCGEMGCYLGLFPHTSEEYHYRWINDIIRIETGVEIKPKPKSKVNKKKPIPKKIKTDIWNKYIGKNIGSSKCLVCNNTEISQMEFVAGHVIAENNGGGVTEENLRPICGGCNSSMGTMDMKEYIVNHYPQNFFRLKLGVNPGFNGIKEILL